MSCEKSNCTNPKIPRGKYCETHRSHKETKCLHDKRKSICKECRGGGICDHGKRRTICKQCRGGGICEHGKRRTICKECGGGSICEHNRIKSVCKECGGSSICEHQRHKSGCKECGGHAICEHGRIRTICKECGGGAICEHGRIRTICKECGGTQICEHGKRKSVCKECGGSQICKHNKNRNNCIICKPEISCILCKSILPTKYKPYCFRCFCYLNPHSEVCTKYKLKETYVVNRIKEKFIDLEFVYNKRISGGCSRRIPDLYLHCGTHNLVVEIDENQHSNYSCENRRIMELFQDGGSIPLVVIRFNPDTYIENDEKQMPCFSYTSSGQLNVESCFKERFTILSEVIQKYSEDVPFKEVTEVKLYYTEDQEQ